MFKRFFPAVAMSAALVFGAAATPAFAEQTTPATDLVVQRLTSPKTTRYPAEGGTWTYGNYGDFKIHSDYYHKTKKHGSSCELDGTKNRSIDTAKDKTSYSYVPCLIDTPLTSDSYWYRIC